MPSPREQALIDSTEELPQGFDSRLEYLVFLILLQFGYREGDGRGNSFVRQVSVLGGRGVRGGGIIDFVFTDRYLAIAIQGEYHHEATVERRALKIQAIAVLNGQGYRVVELGEIELLEEPYAVVRRSH